MERLGRATHVSLDAVRAAGSKTFFVVPDSVDKFCMKTSQWPAPGIYNPALYDITKATQFIRKFVNGNYMASSQVAAQNIIAPYNVGVQNPYTQAAADAANADSTSLLLCACFGLQAGVVLEVDYASNFELIPTSAAPPGVTTSIQLPDSRAMDNIFASVAVLAAVRPQLVQADGDRTITSTATNAFGDTAEAKAVRTNARTALAGVMSRAMKATGSELTKAKAEGFWDFDWLRKGHLGPDKGGISWSF